ncbi:MAG: peptidoglycan bridge formation glycyltransferase FemA/FemB family protein, partial [Kineosporiaceae bacterium]
SLDTRTARRPVPAAPGAPALLRVRAVTAAEHAAAQAGREVSFLQTPAWAAVKAGWRPEHLAWTDERGDVVGTALVLHRSVPGTRRSLAYLPEGPDLPWRDVAVAPAAWLDPLVEHLREGGAFAVRIGPRVPVRRWTARTAKAGLADPAAKRFADLPADAFETLGLGLVAALREHGWSRPDGGNAFGSGQPRLSVEIPLAGRDADAVLAGMNTQWRRAVRASAKAGVTCREGGRDELATFCALYRETAARDGFTPRPDSYFTRMWDAMREGPGAAQLRLHLAEATVVAEDGTPTGDVEVLAAALTVDVGQRRWYSYGASTGRRRQVQASTALQWHMLTSGLERGAHVHDLRGIADTLDPEHPQGGLLRFKLGTGGDVVEYAGEWELVLSRPTAAAVRLGQAAQGRLVRARRSVRTLRSRRPGGAS